MTSKYRRGFEITRDSLRIFTHRPTLLVLPALRLLAVGTAFAVLGTIVLREGLVTSLLTDDLYKYSALFRTIAISSSVATFFIVPIIVLDERRTLRRQLRRSGSLFRDAWGEGVSATLGVSLVFLVVALPGVALGMAGYAVLDGVAAVVALVGGGGLVVAAIVGS